MTPTEVNEMLAHNEPPAELQEKAEQAFAQSAAEEKRNHRIRAEGFSRAPRSDKGKPRPKPQLAPEQKAGGITPFQANELRRFISQAEDARSRSQNAVIVYTKAEAELDAFIDSLAK